MVRPTLLIILLVVAHELSAEPGAYDANEEQKVQAYIKQQQKAGVSPAPSGPNWKPGYTCADLKKFSFKEYCECRYYYVVHGRYYPKQ